MHWKSIDCFLYDGQYLILYLLKTAEKLRFSAVFRRYKMGMLARKGLNRLSTVFYMLLNRSRGSFSTYAKFSEKLSFLTTYVSVSGRGGGGKNDSFLKNFALELNKWSLTNRVCCGGRFQTIIGVITSWKIRISSLLYLWQI